jgi:hypothetical protein
MRKQQITSFAKNEQITSLLISFFLTSGAANRESIAVSCHVPSLTFRNKIALGFRVTSTTHSGTVSSNFT